MMSIIKGDMLKYLVSSSISFISSCVIIASAGNDKKIDYATLVNSLKTAKQYLEEIDNLITQEEFQKISKNRQIPGRNIISLNDIVYFVFLKKICSIDPNSPFWTLGGELFYGNNRNPIVFKKLVLDSSKADSKPVIQVIPQDQSKKEEEVTFSDITKIIFYVDNNIVLQDTILKDFYGVKNVFSIFDYENNYEVLKDITGYILGTTNDDTQRAHAYVRQIGQYDTDLSYHRFIFQHDPIKGENVFKDAWEWEDANNHKYERHTQLLWEINFNEDYAALLYKLCSSQSFFNSLDKATVQKITVDFFNFFPALFYKKNEDILKELIAARNLLLGFKMDVNPVTRQEINNNCWTCCCPCC